MVAPRMSRSSSTPGLRSAQHRKPSPGTATLAGRCSDGITGSKHGGFKEATRLPPCSARPPRPGEGTSARPSSNGTPLGGDRSGSRSRFAKLGLATVTSSDSAPVVSLVATGQEEEVLRIGQWSVRRQASTASSLIYVDMTSGTRQSDPPQEVLFALDLEEATAYEDLEGVAGVAEGTSSSSHAEPPSQDQKTRPPSRPRSRQRSVEGTPRALSPDIPCFRRIVLGTTAASRDLPLRMARDLLEALREDASMFEQLQKRFSDFKSEDVWRLDGSKDLPEVVENAALELRPGQVSDVIAAEPGMCILLRIS
eukprot:TRINITY_DN64281_c0_g1_i1.p1 TRINITY_DN64281_c0_g1~~TRINITY_DN64281_c0_g1_i1.p1  ORF type:complete len:335 (-),score=54.66 TRINITY_DN64281_c0_g1_i1:177-1106(-)